MIKLQIVQEIVGYFKHMDELDNLDRLESENQLDLGKYLEEVCGEGIVRRYLE